MSSSIGSVLPWRSHRRKGEPVAQVRAIAASRLLLALNNSQKGLLVRLTFVRPGNSESSIAFSLYTVNGSQGSHKGCFYFLSIPALISP